MMIKSDMESPATLPMIKLGTSIICNKLSVSSPATCNGFKPESWTGGGVYAGMPFQLRSVSLFSRHTAHSARLFFVIRCALRLLRSLSQPFHYRFAFALEVSY